MEALERIRRVRVQLQRKNPFFAYLSLSLKPKEVKSSKLRMAIDIEGNLYYNKDFVEEIEEEQLMGTIIHEILHLALLHLIRMKDRKPQISNIADDIVVNELIKENGFVLPRNVIWSNDNHEVQVFGKVVKDCNKKTSEEIYDEIYDEVKEQIKQAIKDNKIRVGKGKGDGEGDGFEIEIDDYEIEGSNNSDDGEDGKGKVSSFDGHIRKKNGKPMSDEERKAKEKEWIDKVQEAYIGSKMIGKVPVGIERFIGQLHASKVNWRQLLLRYIESYVPNDFTYCKPSKKSISSGYYIPDTTKEAIEVAVGIDVSGSIGQEELNDFISEIVGIARAFRGKIKMHLFTHETEVNNKYVVENGDVAKIKEIKINGGGGTSHIQPMEWVNKNLKDCKMVVWLTDGYSDLQTIDFNKNKFDSVFVISKGGTDEQLKGKRVKIIKLTE